MPQRAEHLSLRHEQVCLDCQYAWLRWCGHSVFPASVPNLCTLPGCQAYISGLFTEFVCPDSPMVYLSTLWRQLWFAELA